MMLSQPFDQREERTSSQSQADSDSRSNDEFTVDCYRRRNKILSKTHRTEWWMAVAVLLLIASMGITAL
jgi:hypothetical protein